MAAIAIPEIIQLFENLLWVNSPTHWSLSSVYYQGTLFVSMVTEISPNRQDHKIRRRFDLEVLMSRSGDIYGLAADCVEQIRREVNQ